jgi:hypothetical protein
MEDWVTGVWHLEKHGFVADEAQATDACDVTELLARRIIKRVFHLACAAFKPFELIGAALVAENTSGHNEVGPNLRGEADSNLGCEWCSRGCRRSTV